MGVCEYYRSSCHTLHIDSHYTSRDTDMHQPVPVPGLNPLADAGSVPYRSLQPAAIAASLVILMIGWGGGGGGTAEFFIASGCVELSVSEKISDGKKSEKQDVGIDMPKSRDDSITH